MPPVKKTPLPTPDFKLPAGGAPLSTKTRAIYETVWGLYVRHCHAADVPHLPPDYRVVMEFLREPGAVYGHVRRPALTRIFQAHNIDLKIDGQLSDLTALLVATLAESRFVDYSGLVAQVGVDPDAQRAALKSIL